jgi:hypothetical protein
MKRENTMRISQMIAIAVVAWSWTLVAQAQDPSALLAVQQVSRDSTTSKTTVTVKNTGARPVTGWGMVFSSQQYTQELFYAVGIQSALPGMHVAGLGGLLPGESMDVVLPAGLDSNVKVNAVIFDDRTAAGDATQIAAMFQYRAAYVAEWQRWALVLSANATPGGTERAEIQRRLETAASPDEAAAKAAAVTAARHAIALLLQGTNTAATAAYLAERAPQLRLHAEQSAAASTPALLAAPPGTSSYASISRAPGTALMCSPVSVTSTSSSPASTTTMEISLAYLPGVGCAFANTQAATMISATSSTVRPRFTSIVCTEQPDFMVFISPDTQTIGYGLQVGYTVSVAGINGFESPVYLDASDLPPGATAYFTDTPIYPGESSTLIIQTSSTSGAQGSFVFTVTGAAGLLMHSAAAELQISPQTPQVNITSADITANQIMLTLSPGGLSGSLSVALFGDNASPTIYSATAAGGSYTISFNRDTLPTANYTTIYASWATPNGNVGETYGYSFDVLGHDWLQSTYNDPHESNCPVSQNNPAQNAWWVSAPGGICQSTGPYSLSGQFLTQVAINGSGLSSNYGWIQTENAYQLMCRDITHDYGNNGDGQYGINVRDYRQRTSAPPPSCGANYALNDQTVARYTDTSTNQGVAGINCGDRLLIFGGTYTQAIKTATDRCGGSACPAGSHHLDNFSTNGSCNPNAFPNYNNTTVIRLH